MARPAVSYRAPALGADERAVGVVAGVYAVLPLFAVALPSRTDGQGGAAVRRPPLRAGRDQAPARPEHRPPAVPRRLWQDDPAAGGSVRARAYEGARVILIVLTAVLILTVGGCACVFWAARGGPRWTHAAARATLAAGHVTTALVRTGRSGRRNGSTSDDGGSD